MRTLQAICWAIILVGVFCLYATMENEKAAKRFADWTDPAPWIRFESECVPLAKAIPDAYVDEHGIIQLPARVIYISHPVCEFAIHDIAGAGADKTILTVAP